MDKTISLLESIDEVTACFKIFFYLNAKRNMNKQEEKDADTVQNTNKSTEADTVQNTNKSTEADPYKDKWMIRPCEAYKDEFKDCKSWKARFNQYFIFGEFIDCTQWDVDYNNCLFWKKTECETVYNELIESENERRRKRITAHLKNNVWERREHPPEDWNKPLPEWMQEREKGTLLAAVRNAGMEAIKENNSDKKSTCTIL
ncbi:hypothetical protein KM043_015149 [Ampulex compressa]|nr:hypothetical protein KM043_015149 [Ampulex compressa]